MNIQIKNIQESKDNPRTIFDDAPMKELVVSIEKEGVKDPITVRRISGDNNNPKYEIIYGHRRYRASKQLKLVEIPCYVVVMTDAEAQAARIREAVLHERLSPLEEAAAFEKFANEQKDVSNKELGLQFGKTAKQVAERRRLSKLNPYFKKALIENDLSMECALEVCRVRPEDMSDLEKIVKNRQYLLNDPDDLKDVIQERFNLDLSSAPFLVEDAKQTLNPKATQCSVCPTTSAANQDLFGVSKKVLCLNGPCYQIKLRQYIDIKISQYENDGKKLHLISDNYNGDKKNNILGEEDYRTDSSKSPESFGVYIDGERVGTIVGISLYSKKGISAPSGEKASPSFANRMVYYRRRMEIFGNRIEGEVRLRLLKEVWNKAKYGNRKDIEHIIDYMLEHFGGFNAEIFCNATGLDIKAIKSRSFYEGTQRLRPLMKKWSDKQLIAAALVVILQQEMINDPTLSKPKDDRLSELVNRYAIPRKVITGQVTAEFTPKEPKKPVKEEKPAPVKKSAKKTKKGKK